MTALLCGLIFGAGLCVSGMTDPKNVIAFLDVTGKWSPNLGGVMLGAIAVHAGWLWLGGGLERNPTTTTAPLPKRRLDAALVGGAALFGVGWGASGYCPGPSIVALGSGALGVAVFSVAMAAGMALSVRTSASERASAETQAERTATPKAGT